MDGNGFRNAMMAASPLLMGFGSDLQGRTQNATQQGMAMMQQALQKKQQDAAKRQALQSMGVLPPTPQPGQVTTAPLGAPTSGPMAPAQALAGAGMYDQALAAATAPGADPYDRFKVVGGDLVDLSNPTEAVYQGRDSGQKARSAVAKLAADFRDGFIDRETYDAMRAKAMRDPNGITIGPDGTVQIGGPGGAALGRAGQNALDIKEIDARNSLSRLELIEADFQNPQVLESLTAEGALKQWGLGWQDFLAPESLTDEQRGYLATVTQARSDILDNVNFTIKEITGAAMTEPEAKRIGATLPNVNDTPTTFKSKLDTAMRRTRMAIARYNMWRTQGLEGKPEDLDTLGGIERKVETRRAELMKAVEKGDMTPEQASAAFAAEFGI